MDLAPLVRTTPWEQRGDIWVKRDDQFTFGGVAGGKVRSCLTLATGAATPIRWKLSAAWAMKPLDCTIRGIVREGGCGGACCHSPSFWPPNSADDPADGCPMLGEAGCTFDMSDRPVTCLLYPLVPNANDTLVLHHRAPVSVCKPNWGEGPPLIDALQDNLTALFGAAEVARITAAVKAGVSPSVQVPPHLVAALADEAGWEAQGLVPVARRRLPAGLITAGAAASPQVNIVARVAAALGIPARVHVPARKQRSPEIAAAASAGAEVIEHRPGYNTVVVARAREDAEAHPDWVHIPFGMECAEAVDATAAQLDGVTLDMAQRLVVPVGSGMTLAGILTALAARGDSTPVVGVVVGADPTDRLDTYAPPDWRQRVQLIEHPSDYHTPAARTSWWDGLELDAHYEAKAAEYVQPGDAFWVVGIRATQQTTTPATPPRQETPVTDTDTTSPEPQLPNVTAVGYDPTFPVDQLTHYRDNPRQGDIGAIVESLLHHGQYRPIVVNQGTQASVQYEVLAGNHTLAAARQLGWDTLAVTFVDVDDDTAARIVVVDNRTNDLATYDDSALADLLGHLAAQPAGLAGTGFSDDAYDRLLARLRYGDVSAAGSLQARFTVPPFSVLDGRQGYWRTRKQEWLKTGIRGEEGREHLGVTVDAGGTLTLARGRADTDTHVGGSIFDPVLCEIACRWYSPPGGHVFDPFAGGTTRGAVAGILGYRYTGVELRPEQVEANVAQLATLPDMTHTPGWLIGDSAQLPAPGDKTPRKGTWQRHVHDDAPYDLLFTCPPYFDLEPYSQDQLDGSAMPDFPDFATWYRDVFARATATIADNRFAVIVVGEVRDKTHSYVNLVGLTVDTFTQLGWAYLAEYTYITPIGSLAIRTGAQFPHNRKPGKGHQNMLVFYNGDPAAIRTDWPTLTSSHVGDLPAGPDPDAID